MTGTPTTRDPQLSCALDLGWRIAEIYALADDANASVDEPLGDALLPLHDSLERGDQLELQVRAAAGDARRAKIPDCASALEALIPDARAAGGSTQRCEDFRKNLRDCHIAIDKELWARREADGKAYELGNGLSDTYNRIYRAYRQPAPARARAWQQVFDRRRVERLKTHLHDLQSRLDARAVAVVSDHLDAWRERVSSPDALEFEAPTKERTRLFLRRQTTIWRQLLAGDKQPEAYLDREQRGTVRNELGRMVWRRYLRFFPAVGLVVAGLLSAVTHAGEIAEWYQGQPLATGAVTLGASLAGAVGITQASVGLTVRTRVREWTDLLWSRAVAKRVTDVTLLVDDLLPDPRRPRLVEATAHAGQQVGAKASALRDRHRKTQAGSTVGAS